MKRILATVRFALTEFGPLIVFWLLALLFGIKPAITGAIIVILVDGLWRYWRGIRFTRIYMLASGLTLIFGIIDLLSAHPFMLKYESVLTNVATGIAFVAGALGSKPLIQEVAEQRQGEPFPERADVRRFFQLFTLVWALYFFLKAGFYLWAGWVLPLTQAMAIRSLVGGISLGLMIAVSATQGRRLFTLCQKLKLLPAGDSSPTREPPRQA